MDRDFVTEFDREMKERVTDLLQGGFSRQAQGPYQGILAATFLAQFGVANETFSRLIPIFNDKMQQAHNERPLMTGNLSGNNFVPKLNRVCDTWKRRADQIKLLLSLFNEFGLQATAKEELTSMRALRDYVTRSLVGNVDASTTVARFVGGLEVGTLALLEALRHPVVNKYRPNKNWLREHLHLHQQEIEWITNSEHNRISAIPPHAIELYDGIVRSTSDYEFIRLETFEVLKMVLNVSLDMAYLASTASYPDPMKTKRFLNSNLQARSAGSSTKDSRAHRILEWSESIEAKK